MLKRIYNMEYNESKYMKSAYENYLMSKDRCTLNYIYKKPSMAKEDAYKDCIKLLRTLDGYNFKFIGHNIFNFSCGFMFEENGTEYFVYLTHAHTRYMRV